MIRWHVVEIDPKGVEPHVEHKQSCGVLGRDGLRCLRRRDHAEPHASIDERGDVVEWR